MSMKRSLSSQALNSQILSSYMTGAVPSNFGVNTHTHKHTHAQWVREPLSGLCVISNSFFQFPSFSFSWPAPLFLSLTPFSPLSLSPAPNWSGGPKFSCGFWFEDQTDWCGGECLKSGLFYGGCKTTELQNAQQNKNVWNKAAALSDSLRLQSKCIMYVYWLII